MSDDTALALATARAAAARARLSETVVALRHRVSPDMLAQDAAATLKEKGLAALASVATSARAKPAMTAAIVGVFVLLLARRRIAAVVRRATGAAPESLSPKSKVDKGPAR